MYVKVFENRHSNAENNVDDGDAARMYVGPGGGTELAGMLRSSSSPLLSWSSTLVTAAAVGTLRQTLNAVNAELLTCLLAKTIPRPLLVPRQSPWRTVTARLPKSQVPIKNFRPSSSHFLFIFFFAMGFYFTSKLFFCALEGFHNLKKSIFL